MIEVNVGLFLVQPSTMSVNTASVPVDSYHDLCDCCYDSGTCMFGWCCPWMSNTCLAYKITTSTKPKILNLLCCMPWSYTPFYNRKVLNRHYGIDNPDYKDCLVSVFCLPCAVIQNENNYNELLQNQHVRLLDSEVVRV